MERLQGGLDGMKCDAEGNIFATGPGGVCVMAPDGTLLGRFRTGESHVNHSVYHDRYRRTPAGWRFAERTYEARYVDTAPLTGDWMSDRPLGG